jgi:hypothetical protein
MHDSAASGAPSAFVAPPLLQSEYAERCHFMSYLDVNGCHNMSLLCSRACGDTRTNIPVHHGSLLIHNGLL